MINKESCRSCAHCTSAQISKEFWCRLRKIKVHSEIATVAFCHHWTKSVPSLPVLNKSDVSLDKQLDFARTLSSTES
ncbi:metal-binding protein [Prochlorococcus sp. MIT 1223]|uniref:metal-binding protein n=1 Tax=Prochlorococcus sp. MIT 1223 TaxID=3096217 RepID=UPI002A7579A5|nr:metal-binding protein [Prochlorococcus sp. MIT 1223]